MTTFSLKIKVQYLWGLEYADYIPRRGAREPPKYWVSRYDTKLYMVVRFHFLSSEEWEDNSALPLLPGQLRYGVVAPVTLPSMDQIDLFEKY